MRMGTRLAAAALVLLTAACGTASGPDHVTAVPSPTASVDPMALVGSWRVQLAGRDVGVLWIAEGMTLFQDCGGLDASWKASHDGGFVAYSSSGDGSCFKSNKPLLPSWVHEAQGFRVQGDDRTLVDTDGRVLVTLLPGGHPQIPSTRGREPYATTPTPSPKLAERMAAPAPVPAGMTPLTYGTLIGKRWEAPDNPRAFLEFRQDGAFEGSDGCNGEGGRFSLGSSGEILAVAGSSTLIGCQNSAVGGWLQEAHRVAIDKDQLVLLDAAAHELGRLRPSSP